MSEQSGNGSAGRGTRARSTARARLTSAELGRIAGMAGFIALLHIVGWGVFLLVVVPEHHRLGDGRLFGIGIALTAYFLGMRHAFDADHIAAIDNTTRKLMTAGRRPLSVGFWFSLGHSSVVFALCALLAGGVKALNHHLEDESSASQQLAGFFGAAVSGTFLMLIGISNLVVLIGIIKL